MDDSVVRPIFHIPSSSVVTFILFISSANVRGCSSQHNIHPFSISLRRSRTKSKDAIDSDCRVGSSDTVEHFQSRRVHAPQRPALTNL